jgi:hypothetical protein
VQCGSYPLVSPMLHATGVHHVKHLYLFPFSMSKALLFHIEKGCRLTDKKYYDIFNEKLRPLTVSGSMAYVLSVFDS